MNTPTHLLVSLAALTKPGDKRRNWAVVVGALLPDLAIFLWAPYQSLVNGVSGEAMWRELYFQAPMQNLIAWFNSIPIYAGLALLGWIWRARFGGQLLLMFSCAALIHIGLDMPVHSEDAYRHFWPFSDWRFHSPLSYWDMDHHARWVGLVEIALAGGAIAILWRRFPTRVVKIALSLLSLFYVAVLAFLLWPR